MSIDSEPTPQTVALLFEGYQSLVERILARREIRMGQHGHPPSQQDRQVAHAMAWSTLERIVNAARAMDGVAGDA